MIISEELRRSNIAEYILYMWQIEDLMRTMNFNIEKIKTDIIDKYDISDEMKENMYNWYNGMLQMIELENIKKSGHLQVIINLVNDLNDLHLWLLNNPAEIKYRKIFELALPHIKALEERMQGTSINDIDVCLHGLYALMLLNLQKKEVLKDTKTALNTFKELISYLASKYHDREKNPDKYFQ
ncbi:MAG: DUF4924 family protein [Bacteroidales bacterium]|nr:DUF4924 family protein [Bacteroidales bacterium]